MDLLLFFPCKMIIAIGLLHLKKIENATIWIIILLEWKQQQKRFPFPLWGSICKEHYVMNWKLSYNVFVCRKETLIYTKKKEREREKLRERDRNTLKSWKLCELKESIYSPSSIPLLLLSGPSWLVATLCISQWIGDPHEVSSNSLHSYYFIIESMCFMMLHRCAQRGLKLSIAAWPHLAQ